MLTISKTLIPLLLILATPISPHSSGQRNPTPPSQFGENQVGADYTSKFEMSQSQKDEFSAQNKRKHDEMVLQYFQDSSKEWTKDSLRVLTYEYFVRETLVHVEHIREKHYKKQQLSQSEEATIGGVFMVDAYLDSEFKGKKVIRSRQAAGFLGFERYDRWTEDNMQVISDIMDREMPELKARFDEENMGHLNENSGMMEDRDFSGEYDI
jgi:hypothetical protein